MPIVDREQSTTEENVNLKRTSIVQTQEEKIKEKTKLEKNKRNKKMSELRNLNMELSSPIGGKKNKKYNFKKSIKNKKSRKSIKNKK